MTHVVGEEGVDFSWARPGAARLVAARKRFVMRYLSWGVLPGQPSYPNGKILKRDEALSYLAVDIAVGLNWEFAARDALDGQSGGTSDAREAVRQSKALGAPAGLVIYYSADWDVLTSQLATVRAYWAAAATVTRAAGYKMGVYGGKRATTAALEFGYHAWQTYAWSGGVWDNRAHIRQYSNGHNLPGTVGADYDLCKLMRLDAGLWGLTVPTTPASDPVLGGMIL